MPKPETILGLSDNELELTIKRFSQALPDGKLADVVDTIVDIFISEVLATSVIAVSSVQDMRKMVKETFKIEYSDEEIKQAIERLKKEKVIYLKGNQYFLSAGHQQQITSKIEEEVNTEEQIYQIWQRELITKYPATSEGSQKELLGDLRIYVRRVLEHHGAETALLINSKASLKVSKSPTIDLNSFLPSRSSELEEIRSREFPAFFREAQGERRLFIAKLLDASFVIHALTIDKTCSELIKWQVKGTLIYLDTNFVYRLLDLQGERQTAATHLLLNLASKMRIQLVVSTRTVAELQASLKRARDSLRAFPIPPKRLAEIAADETTDDNFLTAYWRMHAKESITIDEFYVKYRNIDILIEELGLEIHDKFNKEVENDDELRKEEYLLDKFLRGKRDKVVVNHDAFHRILMTRLRGKPSYNFTEAKFWFLTCDNALTAWDQRVNPNEGLPLFLSVNQLFQLLRFFVPRTDDFSGAFEALLCSPYLRGQNRLPVGTAQVLIDRIRRTGVRDPEVALRLLTDEVFVRKIEKGIPENKFDEELDRKVTSTELAIRTESQAREKKVIQMQNELDESVKQLKKIENSTAEDIEKKAEQIKLLEEEQSEKTSDFEALKDRLNIDKQASKR